MTIAMHHNTIRAIETDQAIAELLIRRTCASAEIAARVGISQRSVSRCIERLRRRGVPVREVFSVKATERAGRGLAYYRITFPAGRVCAECGCGTVLRRSNPSERCELHGGGFFEIKEVNIVNGGSASDAG